MPLRNSASTSARRYRGLPVSLRTSGRCPRRAHVATDAEVLAVPNGFFGGNIGVAGLLTGVDLIEALAQAPRNRRYLLPDVCLSGGRFLDGLGPEDLPRPVVVVRADGAARRAALAVDLPASVAVGHSG